MISPRNKEIPSQIICLPYFSLNEKILGCSSEKETEYTVAIPKNNNTKKEASKGQSTCVSKELDFLMGL